MSATAKELIPGLAGIPAAESAVSFIDGKAGILKYRGFRVETLAEKSNYEEVAYLLLYGKLPTQAELDALNAKLGEYRVLPDSLVQAIRAMPKDGHPMRALQAGLSMLGMVSPHCSKLQDPDMQDEAMLRVLACTGPIIATFEQLRAGKEYTAPDPTMSTAGNFLWMLNGKKPSELETKILDCALVLHAEHTMNASTFAARVVASTLTDPYTMCSSAVGALFGPLHGGANERVLKQLEAVGDASKADAWVDEMMEAKKKVMGFGHRVYSTKDPRATALQGLVRELFDAHGSTPLYDIALVLEKKIVAKLGDRGIHPNVDFFSGIVYQKLGISTDTFTPIFALARVAGYLAHWREQMADNKLFRPGQIFVGEDEATWVDINDR